MVTLNLIYRLRFFTVVIGTIEMIGFSGIQFGWSSLSAVLQNEGVFSYLCDAANLTMSSSKQSSINVSSETRPGGNGFVTCDQQLATLSAAFTASTSFQFVLSLFVGFLFDKFGIRPIKLFGAIAFLAACVCYAFISQELPWLSFVACCLISVCFCCIMFSNLQIANFFPNGKNFVVGLINGAFNSSSVMIPIIVQSPLFRKTSFFILGAAGLLMQIFTCFILLPKFKVNPDAIDLLRKRGDDSNGAAEMKIRENSESSDSATKEVHGQLEHATLRKCILSRQFFCHAIWTAFTLLNVLFFISSHNIWMNIKYPSDGAARIYYSNVFGYCLFCGLLAAPGAGFLVDFIKQKIKKKNAENANSYWINLKSIVPSMAITCLLCNLMFSLIFIQSDNINYVAYLIVMFTRAFLFSLNSSFIIIGFPAKFFGKIMGLNFLLAGLFTALQFLLVFLANLYGLKYVHGFLFALSLLTWLHPIQIWLGPRMKWDAVPLVGEGSGSYKLEIETNGL